MYKTHHQLLNFSVGKKYVSSTEICGRWKTYFTKVGRKISHKKDTRYRICRRKGRSIFGRENIKKSGCSLCGERVKKKLKQKRKSKPWKNSTNLHILDSNNYTTMVQDISTHLTDNFILHCWHEDENKLPKTTSDDRSWSKFVPMHCKNKRRDRLTELPWSIQPKSPFWIHFMQFHITLYIVVGVYMYSISDTKSACDHFFS